MLLFTSPASPWVRRCVVSAAELGLLDRIERVPTRWPHTWATQTTEYTPEFAAATPVARIPALVSDDGLRLSDSHAICDYLNELVIDEIRNNATAIFNNFDSMWV